MQTCFRLAFLYCLISLAAPSAEVQPLRLNQARVRLVAGSSARVLFTEPPGLGQLKITSRRLTASAPNAYPVSVGVTADGTGLFIAVPPSMPAGKYTVEVTAASDTALGGVAAAGAAAPLHVATSEAFVRSATLEVVVDPLAPLPQSARPPVVFVNGFSFGALFTGECELSENTTGTFGRLEEFLVADGSTVVFFDNCRFGTPPIEVLGDELGNVIAALRLDDGSPVPEVDIVAFSMGALVVRSYLTGKQQEPGKFIPPADPKVRKAVLVGREHFGTPLANSVNQGEQLPALSVGSQFTWDLATWHQGIDDLREVDAIAVAGKGTSNGLSDGVAPVAGVSLAPAVFFGATTERTRILPVCHNAPARLLCNKSDVLMAVDSETHPSAQIIRSFLNGTDDWKQIGETPLEDANLSAGGGLYFAFKDEADNYATDINAVIAKDSSEDNPVPDLPLIQGPSNVFLSELMPNRPYLFEVERGEDVLTFSGDVRAGDFNVIVAKLGPFIARVQPAAGAVDTLSVAADSLVSIFGTNLAERSEAVVSLPLPTRLAGTTVTADGEPIPLLFAGPGQINAYLPAGLVGLVQIRVSNPLGEHTINLLLDAAVPAVFSIDGTGTGLAAAIDAVSGELLSATNPVSRGGFVSLFVTGLGETTSSNGFEVAKRTPTVTVGGAAALVLFAGRAPGFVGLNQVNIEIPTEVNPGEAVAIVLTSGKRKGNQVALPIN